MGERPVTGPDKRPTWRLQPPHADAAQGIIISGFSKLPSAQALFLRLRSPEQGAAPPQGAGRWLQTLESVAPITSANERNRIATAAGSGTGEGRSASIAFTFTGLQQLGLSAETLATFSAPFREGMYQEDRLRRLGDKVKDEWQDTVIKGGPQWSANVPPRKQPYIQPTERSFRDVGPKDRDEREASTPITVHALLLLYGESADAVSAWTTAVRAALAPHGVEIVHQLTLDLHFDATTGVAREHFGFADGLSQPIPYDEEKAVGWNDGRPMTCDSVHGVPLGEILIGHTNAHHEKAPGPIVSEDEAKATLPADGAPEGFRNLGLNGSYMVVRELRQRVGEFWKAMQQDAERICADDPKATHVTAEWLAERVVGRSLDGHMLLPNNRTMAPDAYSHPDNNFRFRSADPDGLGCPFGSHVRRANPRDSLAPDLAAADSLLHAANNHRILRRGRKYGPKLADPYVDDNVDRGLLFICLNTDIARQFEFVQQTWLLNSNFHTLYNETDPLVGPKGRFTLQEHPLRRRLDVETFIQMAGGEYFFLPSLPALKYLASK
jgi:Dyp-type peroxidase family